MLHESLLDVVNSKHQRPSEVCPGGQIDVALLKFPLSNESRREQESDSEFNARLS